MMVLLLKKRFIVTRIRLTGLDHVSQYYQIISTVRYRHIYLLIPFGHILFLYRPLIYIINGYLHRRIACLIFCFCNPLKWNERERGGQLEHCYSNLKTIHYNF